jgi:hypothetical protein
MNVSRIGVLRWWPYKLAFVVFAALPFFPATAIGRCFVDTPLCIAAKSVSEFVAAPLRAGSRRGAAFGLMGIAVAWLVVCLFALSLGWRRIVSRLLLALAVTLIFVIFPYFMPLEALGIRNYAEHIFLIQVWSTVIGFPIGYTAFLFYVVRSGLGTDP